MMDKLLIISIIIVTVLNKLLITAARDVTEDEDFHCNSYVKGNGTVANNSTIVTVSVKNDGESILLPCENSAYSNITCVIWKKNDENIEDYDIDKLAIRINNLNPYDSATYSCITCSLDQCVSSEIALRVIIYIDDKSMNNDTVVVGSSKTFVCLPTVSLQPGLKYNGIIEYHSTYKDDFYLMNNKSDIMTTRYGIHSILDNITIEDEGWYTCVFYDTEWNVLASKSAYLHVIKFKINTEIIVIVSIVLSVSIIFIILMAIVYRQSRLKRKYYEWVKKVTITKHQTENESNDIQIPIVHIEKHRSIVKANQIYNPIPMFEYEFPIDWQWEFSRDNLKLGKMLGEGSFGKVILAEAHGLAEGERNKLVAVKMLQDGHTDNDVKDFVCELEIMKMVGKHPNIVNLLGCCSQYGPLYIIVEFALHGNLLDFLRNHRTEVDTIQLDKNMLTKHQLITFASQIASGMEHLASIKCIHRDLAARNILVSEGLVMKIADFGLARDIHNQEYYRKVTVGKLPIRWMAPESLEYRFFDTKTDVWSFGVLFWEIMTLGGMPYSSVPASENLLKYLKQGHRLEKPSQCSDDVYLIMKECWQFQPQERPTFENIRAQIDCSLQVLFGNDYLKM